MDDLADRRRQAAARLRHDLGKGVRFSAPETLEAADAALRDRLARDVCATRTGPGGVVPMWELYAAWRVEEAGVFAAARLDRIGAAVDAARVLAERLPGLSRAQLERLDALTRSIAEECRALWREASGDGEKP